MEYRKSLHFYYSYLFFFYNSDKLPRNKMKKFWFCESGPALEPEGNKRWYLILAIKGETVRCCGEEVKREECVKGNCERSIIIRLLCVYVCLYVCVGIYVRVELPHKI